MKAPLLSPAVSRRSLLTGMTAGAATMLTGCDSLVRDERFRQALFSAENMHKWLQRSLMDREALAAEFHPSQRSPLFRSNGTANPNTDDYRALRREGFTPWRLTVDGLVGRPLSLSLADLKAMPQRIQTTRHDCVEGWSAIGTWQGVPLKHVLDMAQMRSSARYIIFHCMDQMGDGHDYYESVDLVDAFHPQTILAHMLNERTLEVRNGAPLRLRVERQLGYKHAKFLSRLQVVDDLSQIGRGKGGYWEDYADYDWYAGI